MIDLTRVLAGPFATMMLADLGARVVKVERPGGDDTRGYGPFVEPAGGGPARSLYFERVNHGKESVVLDLTDEPDLALLRRMVARADVLVENFRPGVADRLGLGAPALLAEHPGLVYASISGFGHTGPWRGLPAYDAVVQGMAGTMAITGSADGEPVKPGLPVADLSAGLYAFGAITSALLGKARTGRGGHVDVAMYDTTVSLLESPMLSTLATGHAPSRRGNAHYSITPFDTFTASDGPLVVCAANDHLFARLCEALEVPGLAVDPRYVSNRSRDDHRLELTADLERALSARSAQEWVDALRDAGVPCGPVSSLEDVLASPQTQARRMVVDAGGVPIPGNPVKITGYPDPSVRPGAPSLDQHGTALRAEFG